jgi:hypothetical protein
MHVPFFYHISLFWFGFNNFLENQPKRTELHTFLSNDLNDLYAQNQINPHRECL